MAIIGQSEICKKKKKFMEDLMVSFPFPTIWVFYKTSGNTLYYYYVY
jgi:hypothetical protein